MTIQEKFERECERVAKALARRWPGFQFVVVGNPPEEVGGPRDAILVTEGPFACAHEPIHLLKHMVANAERRHGRQCAFPPEGDRRGH